MNAKTLHLFLMLLFTCAFTARAQYSGGSGTAEDPYQISTLTDLKELSLAEANWESHFILKNDIDASATSSWDDGAGTIVGFTPIGYATNNHFSGVFDGQGYTISNLFINRPTQTNVGLFGYIGNSRMVGIIKNIHLEDADITGYTYVGGIAGNAAYASINNVSVSGDINATGVSRVYAGGVAGYLKGEIVKSTSTGTVTAADYVGGLVGYIYYFKDFEVAASRCSSSATVNATSASRSYAGGLFGSVYATINSCYSTGNVVGGSYVGGFAGNFTYTSAVISNCFSTGNVSSTYATYAYTGGFIGNSSGTVENCYYLGTLSVVGTSYIGAFLGKYSTSSPKNYNNYYNSDTGMVQDDDGIAGISMASFSLQSSFPEWDFVSDWEMGVNTEISSASLPYPKGLLYDSYISYYQTIASAGTISGDLGWYNNGDQITITASEAASPYVFAGWYNGDEKLTETFSYTTTVDGDAEYTARYKAEYSGGEGTEAEPYQIANLDDLQLLINTEEDFDKYFILINDIDAGNTSTWFDPNDANKKGFTPIGNYESTKFTGHFNGQGYTISNLYIDRSIDQYTGFFGYTDRATISNLSIVDCAITGSEYVGALIGKAQYTNINDCSVNGSVSGKSNIGGLAGELGGGLVLGENTGIVVNCSSQGNITGTEFNAGGLFGATSSGASIERSVSHALVNGYDGVGGFIGNSRADVKYCYATGNVTGRVSVGGFIGGKPGSSSTSYCFATGNVSEIDLGTSQDEYGYIGGFVGSLGSVSETRNCYAIGKVYGTQKYGGFYGELSLRAYNVTIENCVYDYETAEQPDQNRSGVTALSTAQFTGIANYPEDWEQEWEIGLLEDIDSNTRSYLKIMLGYDYQIYYELENPLAGSVNSDKGSGWFKDGDEITLTATSTVGYEFDGWYINDEKVSDEEVFTFAATDFATYTAKHTGTELTFSGGSGSPLTPYKISTLEDLIILGSRIADVHDLHFVLTNDIDASASIDLNNGLGFSPIGYKEGALYTAFSGKLDGAGYTISNLYINNPESLHTGLFLFLNGEVSNLTLKDCNITGGDDVGIMCGRLDKLGSINRCNISGGSVTGNSNVGGLFGYAFSYIGYSSSSIAEVSYSTIDGTLVSGTSSVGGLGGYSKATLKSSSAKAVVTGNNYVGGLIGYTYGETGLNIEFCSANSSVTAKSYAGGLVGYQTSRSSSSKSILSKSFAVSNVTITDAGGDSDGYIAGGLVGYNSQSVISDCYAVGSVTGLDFIGGLIGSLATRSEINNCYAAVNVSAVGTTNAGLIATIDNDNVVVADCYFDTEITGYSDGVKIDATEIADITGLGTADMEVEASFTAFDFDGVWNVLANTDIDDNARPYLKWETNSTTISVSTTPEDKGIILGTGWFNLGDEVSLTAQMLPGWKVEVWKNGSDTVSTTASYEFTIVEDSIYNLSAIFVQDFSATGLGTEESPYEITTLGQLEELSYLPSLWNKHFVLMNDIEASETSGWNVGDHDEDIQTIERAMGYIPIGDHDGFGVRGKVPFSGVFDGQGYTISGLYINRPLEPYVGMFGYTKGASIKNLNIESADFLASKYVGGLVGYTFNNVELLDGYKSYFHNCHVINSKIVAGSYVGGFAGNMYFDVVTNSSVQDIDLTANSYSGGFVGEFTYRASIDSCYSTGKINTYGDNNGGFAGRSVGSCSITNSYSSCNIEGNQQIGGFVGYFGRTGLIENCYANGTAKAYSYYGLVGGFVGYINNGDIVNCYSSGDVTTIDLFAGGFVGYGDAGDYSHITKCYSTGNVYGRRYLGGFAAQYDGKITYSYATGTVDGSYDGEYGHTDVDIHFAGFVAYIGYSGHIENSFTLSDVKGFNYVCGFTGVNLGYIENCYSSGTLTGTGTGLSGFAAYVADEDQARVIGCYYDQTIANTTTSIGEGKKEGVTGLKTADFAQEVNMPELPFGSIWKIGLNTDLDDNSRPYLKWLEGGAKLDVEFNQTLAADIKGDGWFVDGEEVTLSVFDIQPGLAFSHWELDGVNVSSDNPYSFNFSGTEDVLYTAYLVENNIIAEGDGTESSPYIISTFDELVCLTNVSSIWDKYFELGADIDAYDSRTTNGNYGLSPIGVSNDSRFTGHFDGKGYTISNLFINRYNSAYGQALFAHVGVVDGALTTITNVTLNSVLVGGSNGVGALVGQMENTYVENCVADGLVLGTQSYIGGLIGRSSDDSYIKSSSFKGSVYSPYSTSSIAVGGLVGYSANTNIDYCYAVTDSVISVGTSVGGLVGYSHYDVNSSSNVDVQSSIRKSFAISNGIKADAQIGGLVGSNNGTDIEETYAVANLLSQNDVNTNVGGLVGISTDQAVVSSYFNSDKEGALYNGHGKGINTAEFENEAIFDSWIFDAENNWKMAFGQGGEKRPYFYNMDTYTVTFKAGDNGLVSVGHEAPVSEITDVVLLGEDSRSITAVPDAEYSFVSWDIENGGHWDMDNLSTYIPGSKSEDIVLIAMFKNNDVGINDKESLSISTYPNPTTEILFIDNLLPNSLVRFVDVAGKVVFVENNFNGVSINISHLKPGAYVMVVESTTGTEKIKVIKK